MDTELDYSQFLRNISGQAASVIQRRRPQIFRGKMVMPACGNMENQPFIRVQADNTP